MTLLEKMKDAYLDYSRLASFKRKVSRTKNFICSVLEKHDKPYISYSTGKDSLCLLHLLLSFEPNITAMHHDSGVELPESYVVRDKIKEDWNLNLDIIKSPVDVLDVYEQKDGFGIGANKDIAFTKAMMNPIRKWTKENNFDLAFIGLRKQESSHRRIMLSKHSNYFYAKTNSLYECFPLSEWKGRDIFAYIFANELDEYIHPAYYKDKFVDDPAMIRVSWYCDPAVASKGGFVWLKYYYPYIFRKLASRFPIIRTYC